MKKSKAILTAEAVYLSHLVEDLERAINLLDLDNDFKEIFKALAKSRIEIVLMALEHDLNEIKNDLEGLEDE